MKQPAESKKGFEAAQLGVFTIPGPLLTHLNVPGYLNNLAASTHKPIAPMSLLDNPIVKSGQRRCGPPGFLGDG
jgi:hypothetical protein